MKMMGGTLMQNLFLICVSSGGYFHTCASSSWGGGMKDRVLKK